MFDAFVHSVINSCLALYVIDNHANCCSIVVVVILECFSRVLHSRSRVACTLRLLYTCLYHLCWTHPWWMGWDIEAAQCANAILEDPSLEVRVLNSLFHPMRYSTTRITFRMRTKSEEIEIAKVFVPPKV